MMTVTFQPLSADDHLELTRLCQGIYLHNSYSFAVGLQRLTGWSMVGFPVGGGRRLHVGVRDPDGNLYDARGQVTLEEFGRPFDVYPPCPLREVTLEDLAGEISDEAVAKAAQMAGLLWPELAKVPTDLDKRLVGFAVELEVLSRKYGIWIRSPYPTAKPCLAPSGNDETGYVIAPNGSGVGDYTIDRVLGSVTKDG